MGQIDNGRKRRLRTLESQIRSNYEAFVQTGFALKEIRDDELYREDGFATWDAYLKERVGEQFGIEERQVYRLITCAQVRPKLPDLNLSNVTNSDDAPKWTQHAIQEFARLAPIAEGRPGRPGPDLDALKKRDVERADTLPKEQRTVRVFQRLIAAMRACEADVQERLANAERELNQSLQENIALQERVHHLEAELLKHRLKEQLDEIGTLSVSDRTKLLSVSESPKPAA